jgi:hypothetical protein
VKGHAGTLAVLAFTAWAALEVVGLVFLVRTWSQDVGITGNTPAESLRDAVVASVFAGVGALLVSRRPRNAIGWLLLATATGLALQVALERYAADAVIAHSGTLRGGLVAASLVQTVWLAKSVSVGLVVVLFPEGRLPSAYWRWLLALLGVAAAAMFVGGTMAPGRLAAPYATYDNPLGVAALARFDGPLLAAGSLVLLVFVAAGISLVRRFRSARGLERAQYKWFCFAAAAFPVLVLVQQFLSSTQEFLATSLPSIAAALLPVATAIAILRYRLYDIDRLVGRTLVYGTVTAVLGASYAVLVLGGQALFSSFAGGSNLAIAVSTLVVAALFQPVRSRVQRFVDRRFYRRRYDAQRTLEGFGARLREQIELDDLAGGLRTVVTETMQPAHVSLWLRSRGADL